MSIPICIGPASQPRTRPSRSCEDRSRSDRRRGAAQHPEAPIDARLTRRRFLAGTAAAGAALALDACSGSGSAGSGSATTAPPRTSTTARTTAPSARRARRPGERWDLTKPEGTDLLPQIQHVVVVMMENHSFDNYLGMLGRGDGFTLDRHGRPTNACPAPDGRMLRAFHMPNTCQLPKVPSQAWNAMHEQWDHGRMDGFVRSDSGPVSMGYWTGEDLPFYYGLAKTFPLCDRWFASCMGQTYPNRRFLYAATARGDIRTDASVFKEGSPPNGTIFDTLNRHGIAWKDYFSNAPSIGTYLPVLTANGDKVVDVREFAADCAAGRLPAFSVVEPNFDHGSEENSDDISIGESFVAGIVKAVMASPNWKHTVLIWNYDEHGGYYDHVPPPPAVVPDDVPPTLRPGDVAGRFDRYGFRVPAVVVSPFARKDHVSSVVHDHTSILALLEHKFNLPALTHRDGAADDLLDCLDLSGTPPFLTPPVLPAPRNPSTTQVLCTTAGSIPHV